MNKSGGPPSFVAVGVAAFRLLGLALLVIAAALCVVPLQSVLRRRSPRAAAKLAAAFGRSVLWLMRVDLAIEGSLPSQPVFAVSNHVSWLDIPALAAVRPFCFLAKREVGSWPFVARLAAVQGTVLIDRQRRRDLIRANRALVDRLMGGQSVLLFPEGTTTDSPVPLRFNSSHLAVPSQVAAAKFGGTVAVQPIAIAYSSALAPWVGDDNLLQHVWRLLLGSKMRCTLRFGPATPLASAIDRKSLAADLHARVCAMLATNGGHDSDFGKETALRGECEASQDAA